MSSFDSKTGKWVVKTKRSQQLRKIAGMKRYKKKRQWIFEYKRNRGCCDCGETDPIVLAFDHRSRKHKRFTISKVVYGTSLARLKKEIRKCDVRCANCHARRTYYLKHNKPKHRPS